MWENDDWKSFKDASFNINGNGFSVIEMNTSFHYAKKTLELYAIYLLDKNVIELFFALFVAINVFFSSLNYI